MSKEAIMDLRAAIDEFDQKLKKMREELSEEFKKKFKVICKDIFEKYPDIIKFAINLPWEYKIGKPFIHQLFLETWAPELIHPKQGFAGHCNDSYPWLGIDIDRVPDREQDWKNINQAAFQQIVDPR